jgi:polysaccharide export outer membrane protein
MATSLHQRGLARFHAERYQRVSGRRAVNDCKTMLIVNLRLFVLAAALTAAVPVAAQVRPAESPKLTGSGSVKVEDGVAAAVPATTATPPTYVIGPSDILSIVFWRDKDMSADVLVRPDGNITLPLLNDIQAAGLTPAQLRERVLTESRRYLEDPSPTVVVKEIHSRQVFITGQVEKPGPYPLATPTTVLQLIATAGGLKEYVDGRNILVTRSENGRQTAYMFDYQDLIKHKNFRQNIELKPGDTVVVP